MLVRRVYSQSLLVLILASMISMLGALVDGMVIGNLLGDTPIAAYGIAIPMTVLVVGIAYAISGGGQALCGQALGRGDQKSADSYFSNVLVWGVIFGLVVTILCIVFSDGISTLLGAAKESGELFTEVKAYLLGYVPGSAFIILTLSLSSFMHLENDQNRAIAAAIIGTAVNIAGDFVAVLLLHGGLFEIALATTISYGVMTVILLGRYFGKTHVLSFRIKEAGIKKCGEMLSIGLPSADIQVCSVFRSVFLNRLLLVIASEAAVSAFSIRMSMYNLYGSVVIGFGMATLLVGSFFIGEENTAAIRQMLKTALLQGLVVTTTICVLVWFLARPFVNIYTDDPAVAQMAVNSIRWFALSLPVFVVNSIFAKYYQAIGKSALSHLITIMENLVFVCLFALILGKGFSVDGVWAAFLVTEAATLFMTFLIVAFRNKRFPHAFLDWMLLPEGFGVPEEDLLIIECRGQTDVTAVSERVAGFLTAHGENESVANKLSLCTEELMKNCFSFSTEKKRWRSAYLMLLDKGAEWLLCIRDVGKSFDPKEWLSHHDRSFEHMGLLLVNAAADDMSFLYTLKMNQVSIRLKKEHGRNL